MRWVPTPVQEETMGTVIDMRSREVVDMDRVAALLDRLEWRLDEPCSVPGCSHDGECCGVAGEHELPTAA
jgi:hypothetical protein